MLYHSIFSFKKLKDPWRVEPPEKGLEGGVEVLVCLGAPVSVPVDADALEAVVVVVVVEAVADVVGAAVAAEVAEERGGQAAAASANIEKYLK